MDSSGLPFAYRAWKNGHTLPLACSILNAIPLFAADGVVYTKKPATRWNCTQLKKDPGAEQQLETALTAAGIFYSKSEEIYIDDEQMQYVIYEIEV